MRFFSASPMDSADLYHGKDENERSQFDSSSFVTTGEEEQNAITTTPHPHPKTNRQKTLGTGTGWDKSVVREIFLVEQDYGRVTNFADRGTFERSAISFGFYAWLHGI